MSYILSRAVLPQLVNRGWILTVSSVVTLAAVAGRLR
jgi:hypothetical protein